MANFTKESRLGFIGAGKVGGSIALAMANNGYSVVAAASRTLASAQEFAGRIEGCAVVSSFQEVAELSDVVFITTSDDAIPVVASSIDWRKGQGVVHCSGVSSLDVFDKPVSDGAIPGAFHPLQAFSSVENGVKSVPDTTFGIEGNDEMRHYLGDLAHAIGGNPIYLKSEDKTLYHLSGVMMGNLLTVLAGVSAQVWEHIDYTTNDGLKALLPMMRGVANNLEASGIPDAVAGPYPRGDMGTIRKHLEALSARAPEVLPLYCELALAGMDFAVDRGLSQEQADNISNLVREYKKIAD